MKQWTKTAAWVLFAATMYLIWAGSTRHLSHLPGLGNTGLTLVFVLFSIFHCAAIGGWRRAAAFFAIAAVVSYALEEIGVRTGWIYGAYHYSNMLGLKLGHVPLLIPLAWFMMIYPAWMVAQSLTRGLDTRSPAGVAAQAAIAAMVMAAWDTVIYPGMAAAGNWERGGAYFGVPLHNYSAWLLTTFLVYVGAGVLWRNGRGIPAAVNGFPALPVFVYAFYALSYLLPGRIPALQMVALFAMGMPALLALMRVWLPMEPAAAAIAHRVYPRS